jgi:S-DNA-T family DNA segregation ATPase FtsK/SpoIIIE
MKITLSNEKGRAVVEETVEKVLATYRHFDIHLQCEDATDGLHAIYLEFSLLKPARMKTIEGFLDDLRYALGNSAITIAAPIPDKQRIGITVEKRVPPDPVALETILTRLLPADLPPLAVPLGRTEVGDTRWVDIARWPHALLGGTTGSGKSLLLHTLITTLTTRHDPETLRLVLVDPTREELTRYASIPHLITPVITSARDTLAALRWLHHEMNRRYDILQTEHVLDLGTYHKEIYTPSRATRSRDDEGDDHMPDPLPYLLMMVDELADLMLAYPKELEARIIPLVQMGHQVGIHLILATQRPSPSVLTALLKANIPSRIAFSTASAYDSRTILDQGGAERLTHPGDLLLLESGHSSPERLQSFFITEAAIRTNVLALQNQTTHRIGECLIDLSSYDDEIHKLRAELFATSDDESDEYLHDAIAIVRAAGKASTSLLQRKLRIGYSRAARLMDLLEEQGIIAPATGTGLRKVLTETEQWGSH